MIKGNDVTVIVQGAVNSEVTPKCLKSIRKYLPEAEIILSTWEDSNVVGLDYDKLILNKDPGGADCSRDGKGINNCNRELVSTFEGIKLADRKYTLKIRSDIVFINNKITKIKFLNRKREEKYSYLNDRVLVPSVYSRLFATNPITGDNFPLLFHPSDWLYFGLREDLFALFDIPLTNEPEFSQWFKNRPRERNSYKDVHINRLWKFAPEAYIWTEYLRQNHNINIEDKLDITPTKIELSRHSLVNNFYMEDLNQIGVFMPKYKITQPLMPKVDRDGLYTNYHWKKEYKTLCNKYYIVIPTVCSILNYLSDLLKIKRRKR